MLDYEFNKETSILLYKGKMIDKMFKQRGFSLYSYNFTMLMSKLISWTILKGVKDEQKALMFLNALIETNKEAKAAFESIKTNENYDDNILRNYFAYALKQYSDYLNLGWEIEYDHEFISLEPDYLSKIAKTLGDK
ncbi:F0F1 ATP synthase subunit alpha [Metamycoplasma salivarium]|uniref:F0F1 ATP synthase subunit alpha n=5 Tax=Metamycoplasma salivarium TaxID=2124 RepID=A0A448ZYH6_METSV|nr:hypothetical protein [Metamycoplasma salivarium]CAD7361077.1 F0F1 ATP synthase subunit alpha [Metamycoplasma salivarium]VEU56273.1 F0F1 ATP synthase subunit alpha [Metamycoplasma salivarium]